MVSAETQNPKQAIITTKKVREDGRKESKERKEGSRCNIWVDLGSVFVHILKAMIDQERYKLDTRNKGNFKTK